MLLYLLLVLMLTLVIFVFFKIRTKKLSSAELKKAQAKIAATAKLDPNHALLESHKILANTIQIMYKNKKYSSAKLFNKVSKRFKDEKSFWYYHRMRNKVAHETDFKISNADRSKARKVFNDALKALA